MGIQRPEVNGIVSRRQRSASKGIGSFDKHDTLKMAILPINPASRTCRTGGSPVLHNLLGHALVPGDIWVPMQMSDDGEGCPDKSLIADTTGGPDYRRDSGCAHRCCRMM